ncbi:hypothetical protein CYPRO_0008 [Cyclonatronum proteinivorum]|uniref:Uncharacterized protein n=1 Tax=Cyclonatronum proteinivorum TaxID=1457365 RepID=A0A345UFP6_9BACT|nr:hypothetical protein CYPRO_0008 [Cyclonatronum proteinivorum]
MRAKAMPVMTLPPLREEFPCGQRKALDIDYHPE